MRLHALSGQCDGMGDATERSNHALLMHREAGGILAGSVEVGYWTGMGGVCGSLALCHTELFPSRAAYGPSTRTVRAGIIASACRQMPSCIVPVEPQLGQKWTRDPFQARPERDAS